MAKTSRPSSSTDSGECVFILEDTNRFNIEVTDAHQFQHCIDEYRVRLNDKSRTNLKNKSFVWNYFGPLMLVMHDKGKSEIALNQDTLYCNPCIQNALTENKKQLFSLCNIKNYKKSISTNNMICHLRDIHQIENISHKNINVRKVSDFFKTTPRTCHKSNASKKYTLARDLAIWFSRDLMPFHKVNTEGFKDFCLKYKIITDVSELPDRTTLARTALPDVYNAMENIVKEKLHESPRHGCVTMDMWSDNYRHRGYITFTYHFISKEFQLFSFTLACSGFPERHTGTNIRDHYLKVIDQYELKSKVISVVSDKGSNIVKACKLEKLPQYACAGHGLHNLITVDGIEKVEQLKTLLEKCRKIVRGLLFKSDDLEREVEIEHREAVIILTEAAHNVEMDCEQSYSPYEEHAYAAHSQQSYRQRPAYCELETATFHTLKRDLPTRWNSLLNMVESILRASKSIDRLLEKLGRIDLKLHWSDYEVLKELCEFLKAFEVSSKIMQASKYPTRNLVVLFYSELKSILVPTEEDSEVMKLLKENMQNNFSKRFVIDDVSVAAALLDPQLKNLFVINDYLLEKGVDKTTFLKTMVNTYIKDSDISFVTDLNDRMAISGGEQPKRSRKAIDIISEITKKHVAPTSSSESVIDEINSHFANNTVKENVDILQFWMANRNVFKYLAALAQVVYCIPATSAPSEQVFSIA